MHPTLPTARTAHSSGGAQAGNSLQTRAGDAGRGKPPNRRTAAKRPRRNRGKATNIGAAGAMHPQRRRARKARMAGGGRAGSSSMKAAARAAAAALAQLAAAAAAIETSPLPFKKRPRRPTQFPRTLVLPPLASAAATAVPTGPKRSDGLATATTQHLRGKDATHAQRGVAVRGAAARTQTVPAAAPAPSPASPLPPKKRHRASSMQHGGTGTGQVPGAVAVRGATVRRQASSAAEPAPSPASPLPPKKRR